MTTYALVRDGRVVSVGLPEVGELEDGRKVSNFHKLDAETLRPIGWLPVEDPGPPDYDPETEAVGRSLSVDGDRVVVVYAIDALPPAPPPEPVQATVEERLDNLIDLLVDKRVVTRAEGDSARRPRPQR